MPLNLEVIKTKLVNPRPFEIACIIDEDAPALIAEVERLKEALERIATHNIFTTPQIEVKEFARKALDGDK